MLISAPTRRTSTDTGGILQSGWVELDVEQFVDYPCSTRSLILLEDLHVIILVAKCRLPIIRELHVPVHPT